MCSFHQHYHHFSRTLSTCVRLKMYKIIVVFIFFLILPVTKPSLPGLFYWKPRLTINFNPDGIRTKSEKPEIIFRPYQLALAAVGVCVAYADRHRARDINPTTADMYTNMYRWTLRYMHRFLLWLEAKTYPFMYTQHVWESRYMNTDDFIPAWMRKMIFFISDQKWAKEIKDKKGFDKHAGPLFSKWHINNFLSGIAEADNHTLEKSASSVSD